MVSKATVTFDEDVVYTDEKIVVHFWSGSYYMNWATKPKDEPFYAGNLSRASRTVFDNKYKGSFDKWFEAVQKRERTTMESYLRQADDLIAMAESIRKNNGF